ncbi:MAG: TIM barrel protein [candidate division FCPU426 bacterium]
MDKIWDSFMAVGIVHPMAFPASLKGEDPSIPDTIRVIAEDGFFTAADVTWVKDPEARKQVATTLRQSGLRVNFAGQVAQLQAKANLNAEDPAERDRSVALMQECVDMAEEMGARSFSMLSGPDPGEEKREQGLALLVESLKRVAAYAKTKGLPCSVKVFDRDVEKKCLIGKAEICVRLAEAMRKDFPDFGLGHDLSHIPLLDETPAKTLALLAPFLVQAHMGNCVKKKEHPLYGDAHPLFGIEGGESGAKELTAYLKVLFDIGFLGAGKRPFVGFEMKPSPGVSSAMVIANCKRTFKEAWAAL